MRYPDYRDGLVNLTNSILKNFGAECRHSTLPCLDAMLETGYRNVVLLLFDGMGMDALETHLPENSFLRKHLVKPISSVFPPTTTAATTSVLSGLTPYEHGWLGWNLYFREIDKIVDLFPNTIKDSREIQAADYHVAERYIPYENIGQAIRRAGNGEMIMISPFAGRRISHYSDLFRFVRQACGEPGRKFIYAYWYQPDALMHETGCHSKRVKEAVYQINKRVKALSETLRDTLLLVTADHGHIDTRYEFISDCPEILNTLERPISVESRAAAFAVREGYHSQFRDAFERYYGNHFMLLSKEEVLTNGLFGNGIQHPRFKESIGDYLAIATGDTALVQSHESRQFAANHAGLTEQEMAVPLIAVDKH